MPHMLLTRFERRVLRPVSFAHGVLLAVLLFHRDFLIIAPLAVLWFFYGIVGQSLHKDLSTRQLAQGAHVPPLFKTPANGELESISPEEAHQLGRAIIGFDLILSVTMIITSIHFGLKWFLVLALGIAAVFLIPLLSALISLGSNAFLKVWQVWRNAKH
jgi:hypothetical protein